MKKKKTRNYRCYRGTLHTFGDGGILYNKIIYFRFCTSEDGKERAKEILTGYEFPTAIGVILGIDSNVENFVTTKDEVFDYEVDNYLMTILFDERIRQREVNEILFPRTIDMTTGKRRVLK